MSEATTKQRRRARLGFAVLVALAATGSWSLLRGAEPAAPSPAPVPQLKIAQRLVNLGTARRAQRLEARYTLENTGAAPLILGEAWGVGCQDCVPTMTGPTAPIPPGGKGDVVAVIDTTHIGGRSNLQLYVKTNDPKVPVLGLKAQFEVEMMVEATPGYARYNYVQREPTGTIAQTIGAKDLEDLQVVAVRSPYPFLKIDWSEAKPNERQERWKGRQWRLASTLSADAPVGALRGTIDVTTNHDTDQVLHIPVSGFVRPRYAFTPEVLDFGDVTIAAEGTRATVFFTAFSAAGLKLTAVRTTVPGVRAELKPIEPPHRYEILLVLEPGMKQGSFDGQVLVETADSKQRRIEVPLKGRVITAAAAAPTSK